MQALDAQYEYVMMLVGLVNGQPHPFDKQYVVEYDPGPENMPQGECLLRVTKNIDLAKRFPSRTSAHEEWRRIDPRKPIRADGRPNRPLTAWSVFIQPV